MSLTYMNLHAAYKEYNKSDTKTLYDNLGWSDLVDNPAWRNTCAIRMSLALLDCGVNIPGRIKIKSGEHKDKWVEPGQNKLSNWLVTHLGAPEVLPLLPGLSLNELAQRKGIVSFMGIPSYEGGHIDIIEASEQGIYQCSRSCYFDARELRFWEIS